MMIAVALAERLSFWVPVVYHNPKIFTKKYNPLLMTTSISLEIGSW
jgi:hypothetical protein